MPTLTDDQARDAAHAVDWYVRYGYPEERIRMIVLGEVRDERFEAMMELRRMLQDLIMETATIGRWAYDFLRGIPWDDAEVVNTLERAKVNGTKATIRGSHETMELFADVAHERAVTILDAGNEADARQRQEARRLAAAATALRR